MTGQTSRQTSRQTSGQPGPTGEPADRSSDERRCTALDSRDDWAALVTTPPCDCPRCAPEEVYVPTPVDDGWLRRSGSSQRLRVARFELGATGRAVLG